MSHVTNKDFLELSTAKTTKQNNNKYNQKLPHIYVMTKWMANSYFLS